MDQQGGREDDEEAADEEADDDGANAGDDDRGPGRRYGARGHPGADEPVTFTIKETNDEHFTLSPQVKDFLPAGVEYVSATSSQGQCSFVPGGPNGSGSVECDLGALPSGATAVIDVVVIPTQPGIITNHAVDLVNQASASVSVYPSWVPAPLGKAVAVAGGAIAIAG